MAAAQDRNITFEEMELLSFLCQNIVRKLCEEAAKQGLSERDLRVVQAVVCHFNRGPTSHQIFDRLVWQLAHTIQGEWFWSMSPHSP